MQMANAQPSPKSSTQRPASNQLQPLHSTMAAGGVHQGHLLHPEKAQLIFNFEIIERAAKEFSKGNTHILESLTMEAPEDPFDDTNEQANLVDNDSDDD